ncbi:outer membrane protein assembly factor BamD [Ferrovibrio sp.]|uniref:outer membrane protein assembly factor BamD n=1 Tax=Ferrovibrio sp. TaxID=1917215 RepID=UPI003D14A805
MSSIVTSSIPARPTPSRGLRRMFAAGFLLLALAACAAEEKPYVEEPVDKLYNRAVDFANQGNWEGAAKTFDEVERQHPYSTWATKAQIMAAYSWYQRNAYDDAIAAADRFLQLHPGHKDTAYAYYLKAISYYEQIADVARDQGTTQKALDALNDVVQRFPTSEYARDARLKIDLTRDHLAGKEMTIGRYYQRQGQHIAAINRFKTVVEKFQTTTHVPEALHRITESYLALGVIDEAQNSAAVLGHNYPGSEWYVDTYAMLTGKNVRPEAKEGSWLSRLF